LSAYAQVRFGSDGLVIPKMNSSAADELEASLPSLHDFLSDENFAAQHPDQWLAQAELFLASIPALVEAMSDCDVMLYQAGADPHIDDPLGGWLTTAQLRERDRVVFESAKRYGVPIAWNLAGGYQQPLCKVLEIHDNTMLECAAVYA